MAEFRIWEMIFDFKIKTHLEEVKTRVVRGICFV
jgi:hypothetical protein